MHEIRRLEAMLRSAAKRLRFPSSLHILMKPLRNLESELKALENQERVDRENGTIRFVRGVNLQRMRRSLTPPDVLLQK